MERYGIAGYERYEIHWYADSEDGANMARIFTPDDVQIAQLLDDDLDRLMRRVEEAVDKHLAEQPDPEALATQLAAAQLRIKELETAIKAALAHISSHQVYDKDTRGVLERALAGIDLMGNPTAK